MDNQKQINEERQRKCIDLFFKVAPVLNEDEKAFLADVFNLSGLEKMEEVTHAVNILPIAQVRAEIQELDCIF